MSTGANTVELSTMAHLTVNDGSPTGRRLDQRSANNISFHCLFVRLHFRPLCHLFLGNSRRLGGEWNVWLQTGWADDDGCNRIIDWELQEAAEVDLSWICTTHNTSGRRACNGLLWIAVNYSRLPAGAGAGGGGRVMVVMVEGDLRAIEVTHLVEKTTKGRVATKPTIQTNLCIHYWFSFRTIKTTIGSLSL